STTPRPSLRDRAELRDLLPSRSGERGPDLGARRGTGDRRDRVATTKFVDAIWRDHVCAMHDLADLACIEVDERGDPHGFRRKRACEALANWAGAPDHDLSPAQPCPGEVVRLASLEGRLCVALVRAGQPLVSLAPVEQDGGYVGEASARRVDAKNEVVVLGPAVTPVAADTLIHRAAHHQRRMCDRTFDEQIPFELRRFRQRVQPALVATRTRAYCLAGHVAHARTARTERCIGVEERDLLRESCRVCDVIGIHAREQLTVRGRSGLHERRNDAARTSVQYAYAAITRGPRVEQRARRIGRTVVYGDDFVVGV